MIARCRPVLVLIAGLAVAPASAAEPGRVSREVLPNGVRILVREDPSAGVVAVSLQIRAGSRFETLETAGITNFVHRAMLRGTARRSGVALAEALERLGGGLEASGEIEHAGVRGRALARHWEPLLALVAEATLAPTFPDDEIDKERRLILSELRTRAETPLPRSIDVLLGELYGPHPDGRGRLGTPETVARLSRGDLVAHHRAIYRPDGIVLAVSGGVERERVVRTAGRLFGRLPAPQSAPDRQGPAPGWAAPGGRHAVKMAAQQAQILTGFLLPGLDDPEYPALRVLGAVLGGGMSGRLYAELRENLGLAYSLGTLIPLRTGPTFLIAYLGTAPDNVTVAEAALQRELERIRTEPPTEAEVARAKAFVLGAIAMDRRTNARHAWYLAFGEVVGAGWDFSERYVRAIAAVTVAEVAAAARRHLERPTVVVLSPP